MNQDTRTCGRNGRSIWAAFLILAAFSAGAVCGVFWERNDVATYLSEKVGISDADADSHVDEEPLDPIQVEAELTRKIREMNSAVAALKRETREGEIQYGLLLDGGYSSADTACTDLRQRQHDIGEAIRRVEIEIEQTESLKRAISDIIRAQNESGQDIVLEQNLARNARRILHRAEYARETKALIPVSAWLMPEEGLNKDERGY